MALHQSSSSSFLCIANCRALNASARLGAKLPPESLASAFPLLEYPESLGASAGFLFTGRLAGGGGGFRPVPFKPLAGGV